MASADEPADITDQLNRLTVSDSSVEFLEDRQELGRGAYGTVFKVRYRGSMCAAKEIHSILIDAADETERKRLRDNFIRECFHCSKFDHPNIVRFIGIYQPPQQFLPIMIMELMDESLRSYAEKENIIIKTKISILRDVAEGLVYLHSFNPPVIHRDLSPNNVLLKHLPLPSVAKIGDLGVSKVVNVGDRSSRSSYQTKAPGTSDFMPPEAFTDKPMYNTSLDVFSFGGIVLYTINGEWPAPTAMTDFDPITRSIRAFTEVERRQQYLDMMIGEAEVFRSLVVACLDNDPVKRPSMVNLSEKIKLIQKVCLHYSNFKL